MSPNRKQRGGVSFGVRESSWDTRRRTARDAREEAWLMAAAFLAGVLLGGGIVAAAAWL